MNDDFIYKALPKVNEEFAESLYARLSVQPPIATQQKSSPGLRNLRWSQVGIMILALLLLVAWSQIRLWIRYVPIGDFWLVEFSLTQPATDVQAVETVPTPAQLPTEIIDGEMVMLLPGYYSLAPDWIPDGFSPTQVPGPGYSYEDSIGMWSNEAGETIRLFVVPKTGGARPYAPPGMYKELRIHDYPAILIYGRLAPNSAENPQAQRQWDKTLGLQLSWSIEESIYTLETLGPYISETELIRMADSMNKIPAPSETPAP
jgi:hypothetical protein